MKRQVLDNGKWFDVDAATRFEEDTWWNGNNHISKATGTQWDHEALYRTASGTWILHWWSQWQGSEDRWTELTAEQASAWLIKNEHFEDVPEAVLQTSEV